MTCPDPANNRECVNMHNGKCLQWNTTCPARRKKSADSRKRDKPAIIPTLEELF